MPYEVLTLDTQAFNTNSFDLDGGWLAQLKQFKGGPTQVVISEIVVRELIRQLGDKIRQAKDKFEAATKDALLYGLDAQPANGLKLLASSPRALAEVRVRAYLDALGAIEVPANLASAEAVLDAYFKPAPPFAGSGKKKAEFPDAFALMSLEAWAKAQRKPVLAVSNDGDWTGFADKSSWIDVLTTIEDALAAINAARAEEARKLVLAQLTEIDDQDSATSILFRTLLSPEIDYVTVYPEIESAQPAEVDSAELSLMSFVLAGDPPDFEYDIVQVGPHTVAASIDLLVMAKASAYVRFSTWDSIDREEIVVGGHEVERVVENLEASVIATWVRNGDDWMLDTVELVSIESPNLGLVEMDWGSERDDGYGED